MNSWGKCWLGAALVFTAAAFSPAGATESAVEDAAGQTGRTQLAEPPIMVPDFMLTDQDAKPFKFSDLRGRTTLVFFGFTHCQSVCPPTLQKLRQVQRALGDQAALTTVFISVDGERDTPAVMKDFLQPFMPGFTGLTGDPRSIRDIAAKFSAVFFKGMPADNSGGYNVEHTSQVYLVDKGGRMRAILYNAPAEEIIRITDHVAREKN